MELTPEVVFTLIQSQSEFPIDFDDAWQWIGYTRKDTAKDLLTNGSFHVDIDYKIFTPEQTGTKKKGRGGHNRELIVLAIDSFKSFCMMAGTKKGGEVRLYFLRCEAELKRRIEEERNQSKQNTQQQLISAMISPNVVSRQSKFPEEFYQMLYRKRGQGWETRDPKKFRPACVGTWTNQTVYDRMLGGINPDGVKEALNKVNPRRENGTRKDRHHWHLKGLGEFHLNTHLYALTAIANTVPDGDWDRFMYKVAQAFPNDEVLQLTLWDIFEEMEGNLIAS
jgi:phage anti-repressor protein